MSVASGPVASSIPFDNATNGFVSTDVQAAIEEARNGPGPLTVNTSTSFIEDFILATPPAVSDEFGGWIVSRTGSTYAVSNTSYIDQNHPGVLTLSVEDGLSYRISLNRGSPNGSFNFGASTTTFEALIRLSNLSVLNDEFRCQIGFHDWYDTTLGVVNGVYFEYDRLTSTNWLCRTTRGALTTTLNSGVAVSAGQWIRLRCVVVNQTSASFSIRGTTAGTLTSVGSNTTNIPGANDDVSPNIRIGNVTQNTPGGILAIDYWAHEIKNLVR